MNFLKLLRQTAQRMPFRDQLKKELFRLKQPIYKQRLRAYAADRNRVKGEPRILVLMNGGIGNAIEATPVVQAIRMRWPASRLVIFAPPGDLFLNWCVVDQVITKPDNLRGQTFDMTFVTHASEEILDDIKQRIGIGKIYSLPYVGGPFLKPEREYNTDMMRKLGYKGSSPPLYVAVHQPELELPAANKRVVLAPGGKPVQKWRYKRWPFYPELARTVLEEYEDAKIYVVGTEQDDFENPEPNNNRIIDCRGKLSLSETAWLMQHSTLAIGNDCGPMHIADAVQAKALVIFGSTCEIKNGPLYKAVTISSNVDYQPYQYDEKLLLECDNPILIDRISVEKVMERIRVMMRISG